MVHSTIGDGREGLEGAFGADPALLKRIRARVVESAAGCWVWQGSLSTSGYGQISVGGRMHTVHRVTYEAEKGPISPGLQIDHLCRIRACCNPAHLEAVTPRENTIRGDAGKHFTERAARITHCPKGHPYSPENTAVRRGRRHCRACATKSSLIEPASAVSPLTGDDPGGRTVAALYVESGGCYFDLPGVDPWDEERDARLYAGPHPVVAHPPCQRWGKYWAGSPLVIARTGRRLVKGDDGGCFKAALEQVRQFGGILEHPEHSHAWAHFDLNKPPREGGWIAADMIGGWTCRVDQGRYGHWASKPTWLYAFGVELPLLDWRRIDWAPEPEVVERYGMAKARRIGQLAWKGGGSHTAVRSATPIPFRNLLLSIARVASPSMAKAA